MRKLVLLVIALTLLLVGTAGASTPILDPDRHIWHQGASSTDWSLPGTTNFDYMCSLKQNGVKSWDDPAGATSGSLFIIYPVTYEGGNTPIMFANVMGSYPGVDITVVPLFAGAYIYWASDKTETYVQFAWQTIGVCP